MGNSNADHKPLVVRIVVHSFDQAEIPIPVFEVELSQESSGMWCETFATLDLLNAFLKGVRCGLSFPLIQDSFTFIPNLREMPSGWDLHRAPYQLWPNDILGENETEHKVTSVDAKPKKLNVQWSLETSVNWCYGCKENLPDSVEIKHDDHEGIPWHRVSKEARSDSVVFDGGYVDVCGPVFRQKRTDSGEAIKRILRDDQ